MHPQDGPRYVLKMGTSAAFSADFLIPLAGASRMRGWYALATAHGTPTHGCSSLRILRPSAIGRCACLLPMNYSREEALFALALEKPAEKRASFLDAMCEGDAALRQRLEALLAARDARLNPLATQAEAARREGPRVRFGLISRREKGPDSVPADPMRFRLLRVIGQL
jgi:hypothetical protein